MRCARLPPLHAARLRPSARLFVGGMCLLVCTGAAQAQMGYRTQPSTPAPNLRVVFVPLGPSVQQLTLDLSQIQSTQPHWEGRIGLGVEYSTTPLQDRMLSQQNAAATGLNVRSAHILSDYYFSGGFRATAGLVRGSLTRSIWSDAGGTSGLNLSLQRLEAVSLVPSLPDDALGRGHVTHPYVGAGYSFNLSRPGQLSAWRFNADLGIISVNNNNIDRITQAFSGEGAFSDIVRDLRFRPVLKISVRYAF